MTPPDRGQLRALDGEQRQRIIAVACSQPPCGRARWTVRLLTAEVIKRKLVPRVGRETIRVLLESHELKPWRGKKMWCVGELDEEYIARMEEVLGLYEKPLCQRAPVLCHRREAGGAACRNPFPDGDEAGKSCPAGL